MSSVTDSGIAVYKFTSGAVTPERIIRIPAQPLAQAKKLTYEVDKNLEGTAPAYPAGFTVLASPSGDRLLAKPWLDSCVSVLWCI